MKYILDNEEKEDILKLAKENDLDGEKFLRIIEKEEFSMESSFIGLFEDFRDFPEEWEE